MSGIKVEVIDDDYEDDVGTPKRAKYKKRGLKKWNPEQIKIFLELYEQFPTLWDATNPYYKDRTKRDEKYVEMADTLKLSEYFTADITVDLVKYKIRTIRNTYLLELNKVEKSKYGPGTLYEPILSWYNDADRFLRNVIKPRLDSRRSIPSVYEIEYEELDDDERIPQDLPKQKSYKKLRTSLNQTISKRGIKGVPNRHSRVKPAPRTLPPPTLLRKKDQITTVVDVATQQDMSQKHIAPTVQMPSNSPVILQAKSHRKRDQVTTVFDVQNMSQKPVAAAIQIPSDFYDQFGRTVAGYLHQLPNHVALLCQKQILNLLLEKCMEQQLQRLPAEESLQTWRDPVFNNKPSSSYYSSPHFSGSSLVSSAEESARSDSPAGADPHSANAVHGNDAMK